MCFVFTSEGGVTVKFHFGVEGRKDVVVKQQACVTFQVQNLFIVHCNRSALWRKIKIKNTKTELETQFRTSLSIVSNSIQTRHLSEFVLILTDCQAAWVYSVWAVNRFHISLVDNNSSETRNKLCTGHKKTQKEWVSSGWKDVFCSLGDLTNPFI